MDQRSASPGVVAEDDSIRPFHVHVPDSTLGHLRRRIAATRWPDKETVADQSQGVQEAKIQTLVQYWGTDYDWRKTEARLNALPMYVTTIEGVDMQFIHVKSPNPEAVVHAPTMQCGQLRCDKFKGR